MSTVQIAIKAEAKAVFDALTDGSTTPAYYYGFTAEYDLAPGRPYRYTAGGQDVITGELIDVDPGRGFTATFRGAWTPEVAALPGSTVAFSLADPSMPTPGVTVLTLRHDGLPAGPVADDIAAGWVLILSGLKTLLETGAPLVAGPQG